MSKKKKLTHWKKKALPAGKLQRCATEAKKTKKISWNSLKNYGEKENSDRRIDETSQRDYERGEGQGKKKSASGTPNQSSGNPKDIHASKTTERREIHPPREMQRESKRTLR